MFPVCAILSVQAPARAEYKREENTTMKLNIDCVRDVLLTLEDVPRGQTLTGLEIRQHLSDYSPDDVDYTCLKLHEAGYISAIIQECGTDFMVLRLDDITYQGHQFLADIRTPKIWKKTKEIAEELGTSSLVSLVKIAAGVVASSIQSYSIVM